MPRRNRNAQAFQIDADKLAAQACRLSAEFTAARIPVPCLDAIQAYSCLARIRPARKSSILRDYVARCLAGYPGSWITITDPKAVTSHGR